MIKDLKDDFAIRIFVALMKRYKEDEAGLRGYNDGAAIAEAYELAERMIEHKKFRKKKIK